jgi:ATP-dependent RNA helicase DHX36
MLMRNKDEQEILSKEKKDRRDYEQIAAIASRMGLYWCSNETSLFIYAV